MNDRLKTEQGDIFHLDEKRFDAAVAFVAGGFTGINAFYLQFKKLPSPQINYLIYSDNKGGTDTKYYKSRIELFDFEEKIPDYIEFIVSAALNNSLSFGNRIAVSGIWIKGLDQIKNETWMVQAISKWLDCHPDAEVTIIDIADNLNKHNILNI